MPPIHFDNSYVKLPERFYTRLPPTPVENPGALRVNHALASFLDVDADWLDSPAGTAAIAGNSVPAGADPIATVYAGHQFGGYNPQLGDGRAILWGEVLAGDGRRYDIQLKGSGPTPYSRGGDGRSPLGPVLREYVVSEAMHALGVPTTRALAAVTTGEQVVRETFLPGAVLARVASSHIRIGTFQFFAAQRDEDALRALLDHVIARHYPDAAGAENPALHMLASVLARQAGLVASWQLLGFIHGVMNTDNMLLSGETIDYGPCAFMDEFHAERVFSSIDHAGRYAYRNQPGIAHWNLAQLAQAMLPLLHEDQDQAIALAQDVINSFPERFFAAHNAGMARKLGLSALTEDDRSLVDDFFALLTEHQLDFTLAFRKLADLASDEAGAAVGELFEFPRACSPWLDRWRQRLQDEPGDAAARLAAMRAANPAFIPRNHLVEEAIRAAEDAGDLAPFHALLDRVTRPHAYDPADQRYALPPRPEQVVSQTFCGT
jgi:uncharacterized protein YdiU (UPF0061 family)